MHPEDRELVEAEWVDAQSNQRLFRCTYRLSKLSGTRTIWVRAAGRFFYGADGRAKRFVGVFVDISDQKRAEQALHDADQRKDIFLATLAHELRNPLAPITNSLEIIARAGNDKATVSTAYGTIRRQVSQLVRMVDDLLDLGRIARDTLELRYETVELLSVIHHVADVGRTLCESRGQRLDIRVPETPVFIHGDPARLAQILSNLVNNAVKFTPDGGQISLSAKVIDDRVHLCVSDTGIGIPADKLDSVFDMFTQASALPGKQAEGLGIGLHLVKRLARLHGGSVSVSSAEAGSGSTFVVDLPVMKAAQVPVKELPMAPDIPVNASRHRVLVVDDNVDAAESMSALIRMAGHEVRMAHDGEAALEAMSIFDADVLLLDIGLPKLSGLEVCRTIRRGTGRSNQLIIALTGWGQETDRLKSREAGFDHHLTKPVEFDELVKLLDEAFTRA
jgi:signal transduction histidine kinase/ActR/RegA family two-component response regulator